MISFRRKKPPVVGRQAVEVVSTLEPIETLRLFTLDEYNQVRGIDHPRSVEQLEDAFQRGLALGKTVRPTWEQASRIRAAEYAAYTRGLNDGLIIGKGIPS